MKSNVKVKKRRVARKKDWRRWKKVGGGREMGRARMSANDMGGGGGGAARARPAKLKIFLPGCSDFNLYTRELVRRAGL